MTTTNGITATATTTATTTAIANNPNDPVSLPLIPLYYAAWNHCIQIYCPTCGPQNGSNTKGNRSDEKDGLVLHCGICQSSWTIRVVAQKRNTVQSVNPAPIVTSAVENVTPTAAPALLNESTAEVSTTIPAINMECDNRVPNMPPLDGMDYLLLPTLPHSLPHPSIPFPLTNTGAMGVNPQGTATTSHAITATPEIYSSSETNLEAPTIIRRSYLPRYKVLDHHVMDALGGSVLDATEQAAVIESKRAEMTQERKRVVEWGKHQVHLSFVDALRQKGITYLNSIDEIISWWESNVKSVDVQQLVGFMLYGYFDTHPRWEVRMEREYLKMKNWKYTEGKEKGCIARLFTDVKNEQIRRINDAGFRHGVKLSIKRTNISPEEKYKKRTKGMFYTCAAAEKDDSNQQEDTVVDEDENDESY